MLIIVVMVLMKWVDNDDGDGSDNDDDERKMKEEANPMMIDVERSEQQQQESKKAIFFKIFVLNFFCHFLSFITIIFRDPVQNPIHSVSLIAMDLFHLIWMAATNFDIEKAISFFSFASFSSYCNRRI